MKTGDTVGEYTLEVPLGKGGMGEVYRARNRRGGTVAIKFLLNLSPEMRARFQQEKRALETMRHPNIVAYLGDGLHGDQPYLVIEYLEGETLYARLERGVLTSLEANRIVRAVCEGLVHGHARGLIHRDLKPTNIFLTVDGGVKILDFGLAKFERDASLTATGTVMGTPAYMAPEQLVSSTRVGPLSDIWAVGAVLYQMRTGRLAYETSLKDLESMRHAINSRVSLPDRTGLTDAEWVIVSRALANQESGRFQSASEMLAALERGVVGPQIPRTAVMTSPPPAFFGAAMPPTRPRRPSSTPARPSSGGGWGKAAGLVLCGILAWYLQNVPGYLWSRRWVTDRPTAPTEDPPTEPPSDDPPQLTLESRCASLERMDEGAQRALDSYAPNGGQCRSPDCQVSLVRSHIRRYWDCTSPERRSRLCWLACGSPVDTYYPDGELPSQCRDVMSPVNPCVVTVAPSAPQAP